MLRVTHEAGLLLLTAFAIAAAVVLIERFKPHAFLALTMTSLFLGVCCGKNPVEMARSFADGVGSVLGSIAMVIGLALSLVLTQP